MGIIGSIRKHSWVAVAIVGIAIIAFIIGDLTKNQRGVPDLGKIGDQTITYQRFNELTEEMENNYKRQNGTNQVPAEAENQIREQVWQNLVSEILTDEQFDKLGLTVSKAEVSDMYLGNFIHPYLRQNFTDPKTGVYNTQAVKYYVEHFDELDTNQRLTWVELEKAVKADRKQQKYSALIARGMYMPKAIAKQIAEIDSKLSNVSAINCTYQSVPDGEVTLTDKDYQNYYDKHKREFRVRQELREINYLLYPIVPTQQDLAKIQQEVMKTWEEFQTTTEEIPYFVNAESSRSYDSSYRKASDFTSPMDSAIMGAGEGSFISPRMCGNEWQMAKVLKVANRPDSIRASVIYIFNSKVGGNITRSDDQAKLLADSVKSVVTSGAMTFEQAVEKYSDDPQKSEKMGDMGMLPDGSYGFLNEDIINNAEGSVFVVKNPQEVGYFVVKVTGKTAPSKKYRVALISHEIVASESTSRAIYNKANQFASENRTLAEFNDAAQKQNLQVRNSMLTSMQYSLAGVSNARPIVQWAYNDKTEVNEVADQVFEADDQYIVACLKDVYKEGYATLDQVRPMIENMVRIEKKAEILKAKLEEAKKAGNDINSVAAKMNVKIDTLDSVSFNGYYLGQYGAEPKVQAAIAASQNGAFVGPIQGAQGVYMVKVNAKVNNPAAADTEAIRRQQEQGFMQSLQALQTVLMDHSKIKDERYKVF